MDTRIAEEALKQAADALDLIGVEWWIDCGALLGGVRDGELIPGDDGLDICCTAWSYHDTIHRLMTAAGFVQGGNAGQSWFGYQQVFWWKGVKLDILYVYEGTVRRGVPTEDPELVWQGSWLSQAAPGGWDHHLIVSEFSRDLLLPADNEVELFDVSFPAPHDPIGVLEARYGPDWDTPDPDWNWALDPFCITEDTRPRKRPSLPVLHGDFS